MFGVVVQFPRQRANRAIWVVGLTSWNSKLGNTHCWYNTTKIPLSIKLMENVGSTHPMAIIFEKVIFHSDKYISNDLKGNYSDDFSIYTIHW